MTNQTAIIPSDLQTVELSTLKDGDRFKRRPDGEIHVCLFDGWNYKKIRRPDDWLIRVTSEMDGWTRQVILVKD